MWLMDARSGQNLNRLLNIWEVLTRVSGSIIYRQVHTLDRSR
jgi:hypothetical protein